MSSPKSTTSIEKLVSLYNNRNKTTLNEKYLVCGGCQSWLMEEIHLGEDGVHKCTECAGKCDNMKFIRNTAVEEILEAGEYPCMYYAHGCRAFNAASTLRAHEAACEFNITCLVCPQAVGNKIAVVEHLDVEHGMHTIALTKPMADIMLEDLNEPCIFVYRLQTGPTSIIMLVSTKIDSFDVCILGHNTSPNLDFTLKVVRADNEYHKLGKVADKWKSASWMCIPKAGNLDGMPVHLHLYFEKYENFEPFEEFFQNALKACECPICLESMASSKAGYQCVNGHNICEQCKKQVNRCPMCRESISHGPVFIKNIAHFQCMCKFFKNGCFFHGSCIDIDEHEKKCVMRDLTCDTCDCKSSTFDRFSYIEHLTTQHDMQILDEMPTVVRQGYIFYKGCVFKLLFDIGFWSLVLLHSPNDTEKFFNYKLEVAVSNNALSTLPCVTLTLTISFLNK